MHSKIKTLEFEKVMNLLKEYDAESVYDRVNILPSSEDLHTQMEKYVDTKSFNKKSVLGIDIYRYGMYPHLEQILIPSLFKIFFKCLNNIKGVNNIFFRNRHEIR